MLEGKHRFLESKSNKAPGKEPGFVLASLYRRDVFRRGEPIDRRQE
jgi:hypothetical protein